MGSSYEYSAVINEAFGIEMRAIWLKLFQISLTIKGLKIMYLKILIYLPEAKHDNDW